MSWFEIGPQVSVPRRLLRVTALGVAAFGSLTSCSKENEAGCFTSTGNITTERRELSPFRTLTTYDNITVTLVQDTQTYAEVRAGKNLQEDIRLEATGNQLVIRNTSRCNWVRRYDTPREVTLHTPRIHDIFLRGQSDIRTEGTFRADTLFAHLIGSGDFRLALQSQYLNMDQYELGDIYLEGRTQELHVTIGGNGSTYARGLPANRVFLRSNIATNGNGHFTVTESLVGTHAGTGTIFYSGISAASASLQISGKGKLVQE
ncbi:GIN domain-containing protein [Hymenobacter wooponensis]|uniref:DUF2807 domain-containing protein n=1 Tax=Hymenobacter wooponensis TaxID=1525360 RepID=A0A4Z0MSU1_9BACT|nr:DUF2807 domain-containing protein [Hymenobacter wooponensis]TGD82317.1 DUF2807 domain-containing protein [Hymenobacter wooponensis]